jgi:hypothetical protein
VSRVRAFTAVVTVKTTKTSGGATILTEAGAAVEGSAGGQRSTTVT